MSDFIFKYKSQKEIYNSYEDNNKLQRVKQKPSSAKLPESFPKGGRELQTKLPQQTVFKLPVAKINVNNSLL